MTLERPFNYKIFKHVCKIKPICLQIFSIGDCQLLNCSRTHLKANCCGILKDFFFQFLTFNILMSEMKENNEIFGSERILS